MFEIFSKLDNLKNIFKDIIDGFDKGNLFLNT